MDSAHKQAVDLMPWYVNGTLAARERAAIEKHLNECLPCRSALRAELRIRGLVQAQDNVPLNAEHGIADLLSKIDGRARSAPRRLRPQLAYGAAVVGAAILGSFLLTRPLIRGAGDESAPFTTLTDGTNAAANRIDIVFEGTIEQTEILEIIGSLGARLIDGPSDLGRYTIAVPVESEDDLSRLIDDLSSDPRVRFAGQNYIAPSTESGRP